MDVVLADDTLACIEEEVMFKRNLSNRKELNYWKLFYLKKDMEEGEEMREVDDDSINDEQSLSRSMSQMTTRGETTQPDEDTHNVEASRICNARKWLDANMSHLLQDDRCVVTAPRKALCPEDDDFMAALDRMVAENIHDAYTRGKEVSKPPAVDIAIPWQVKASLKRPGASRGNEPSCSFINQSLG
jgi:regulator of nonsense transcripts 2